MRFSFHAARWNLPVFPSLVALARKKNYHPMEMPWCGMSLSGDDLGFRADVRRSLT